jgi:hypothetical protein
MRPPLVSEIESIAGRDDEYQTELSYRARETEKPHHQCEALGPQPIGWTLVSSSVCLADRKREERTFILKRERQRQREVS